LIGFVAVERNNGATQKDFDELAGAELIDGLRITQSEHLNNRWFLNAVSMVAAEEKQF
jgi:hypothetical protein